MPIIIFMETSMQKLRCWQSLERILNTRMVRRTRSASRYPYCCYVEFLFEFGTLLWIQYNQYTSGATLRERKVQLQLGDVGHDCPTSVPVCAPSHEIHEWINISLEHCRANFTKETESPPPPPPEYGMVRFSHLGIFPRAKGLQHSLRKPHAHTHMCEAKQKSVLRSRSMLPAYATH